MPALTELVPLTHPPANADPRGEEFAPLAWQWDLEPGPSAWSPEGECAYHEPDPDGAPVFAAFVDGVQRTVMAGRFVSPRFPWVPLHVFEVAAGFLSRDPGGKVRAGGWLRARGIVAPFAAAFDDPDYALRVARALEDAQGLPAAVSADLAEDPLLPLRPGERVFVLDSSLRGIGGTPEAERILSPEELANEGRVRQLALAKVAHLRQLLELGAHLALRAARLPLGEIAGTLLPANGLEEAWALHDGPLFYSQRRRERVARALALDPHRLDEALLARTAGYVKNHRVRPRDLTCVLKTPPERLTGVHAHRAIEPPDRYLAAAGTLDGGEATYAHSTYSFYLRALPEETLGKAGRSGTSLVRVQFAPQALAPLGTADPLEAGRRLAAAVLRERFPLPPGRFQPYATYLLEGFLRGKLTPPARMQRTAARWFGA